MEHVQKILISINVEKHFLLSFLIINSFHFGFEIVRSIPAVQNHQLTKTIKVKSQKQSWKRALQRTFSQKCCQICKRTSAVESLLSKFMGLSLQHYWKEALTQVFSCSFAKFIRTASQSTCVVLTNSWRE